MKKLTVLLFAIVLAFSMTGMAGATYFAGAPSPSLDPVFGTLVNFDDKATGTEVLWNDYVSVGVASITETSGIGHIWRYDGSQSQPNYVGTLADNGWDGTILIEFVGFADKVGIGVADGAAGLEYIYAFDSSMTLLEQYTVPIGSNVYAGIERAAFDIKYFQITGDYFAIDDLQFRTSVPEPATMLLLASGLVGLAGLRMKLHKN